VRENGESPAITRPFGAAAGGQEHRLRATFSGRATGDLGQNLVKRISIPSARS
jgi:hypothetical protein